MEDLTQSQVRSLEEEAQALKKELLALLSHLENTVRWSETTVPLPKVKEALQKSCLLLERMEPAMQALREDIAQARRERNQLSTLYEISQVWNSTLSLSPLLELVMDRLIAVTGAERGFITLLDPWSGELRFAVARNMDRTAVEGRDFQVSRGVIEQVAREGQPVLTDNASLDPRFADRESVIYFGLRSIMAAPLRVRERFLGVVYVDNRIQSGIFSQEDLNLLVAFANQAAIAIENARLFDDLQRTLREITEIKSYMEDIFASVDSGILTTDLAAAITTCNRAAEEILGLPLQEAKGRRFHELFDERPALELSSAVRKVIKEEARLRDYEVSCILPCRGQVTLKLQVTPLKDAQQKTIGAAMVVEDLTEERRLQQTLNRYLAPSVVQEALRMAATGHFPLGGTRRAMSILFADVRGFTAFSERVSPEELVDILNVHLTVAARAILAQGGTLDKFMGDAVMALFNVPVPQPDHTLRAVRAALEIQRRIAELEEQGRPAFRFGVGVHMGEAVAGNVGSPERLDYTAIGDAVNLAKRLQENAKGGQILLSAPAYREVSPWVEARPLGVVYVKGREEPVEVYELLGLREGPASADASA